MYDAISEDAIMPLADWAEVFAGDLFRKRLEPDYLSKLGEYYGGFPGTLSKLGKKGPFWGS